MSQRSDFLFELIFFLLAVVILFRLLRSVSLAVCQRPSFIPTKKEEKCYFLLNYFDL